MTWHLGTRKAKGIVDPTWSAKGIVDPTWSANSRNRRSNSRWSATSRNRRSNSKWSAKGIVDPTRGPKESSIQFYNTTHDSEPANSNYIKASFLKFLIIIIIIIIIIFIITVVIIVLITIVEVVHTMHYITLHCNAIILFNSSIHLLDAPSLFHTPFTPNVTSGASTKLYMTGRSVVPRLVFSCLLKEHRTSNNNNNNNNTTHDSNMLANYIRAQSL